MISCCCQYFQTLIALAYIYRILIKLSQNLFFFGFFVYFIQCSFSHFYILEMQFHLSQFIDNQILFIRETKIYASPPPPPRWLI